MSELRYDWIESQANRLASEECCLSEAEIEQGDDLRGTGLEEGRQGQPEVDRASERSGTAFNDPLDAILEQTYRMLNRPALHSHLCHVCGYLRPCVQQPCAYRATDHESEWVCGECLPGEEAP